MDRALINFKEKHMAPINIESNEIRKLAELLQETGLSEIEIQDGQTSVRVTRELQVAAAVAAPAPVAAAPAAPAAAPVADAGSSNDNLDKHPGAVKSPMVGTAYLQPSPDAASFVSNGQSVSEGDTLMIIEAMKVMNPIKAHKSGTIKQICVNDSQPVEFDEVLMVIE